MEERFKERIMNTKEENVNYEILGFESPNEEDFVVTFSSVVNNDDILQILINISYY